MKRYSADSPTARRDFFRRTHFALATWLIEHVDPDASKFPEHDSYARQCLVGAGDLLDIWNWKEFYPDGGSDREIFSRLCHWVWRHIEAPESWIFDGLWHTSDRSRAMAHEIFKIVEGRAPNRPVENDPDLGLEPS